MERAGWLRGGLYAECPFAPAGAAQDQNTHEWSGAGKVGGRGQAQGHACCIKLQFLRFGFGNLPALGGHEPRLRYGMAGQFGGLHMQHCRGA